MINCAELLPGGEHAEYGAKFSHVFSFDKLLNGRIKSNFLCPLNLESLFVEGDYSSENF